MGRPISDQASIPNRYGDAVLTTPADPNDQSKTPDIRPTAMYMIEGSNDSGMIKAVYVGITNDLGRRMQKHRERDGMIWQMLANRCLDQVSVGGLWCKRRRDNVPARRG